MKIEEAIEILENGEWWEEIGELYEVANTEYPKLHDAVDMAIEALKEKLAAEKNEPLTIKIEDVDMDEMREILRRKPLTIRPYEPERFESKWISVEERLPEPETEEVLVLLENGDMFNVTYESEIDGCKFGTYRPCFDPHTLGFTDSEWIEIEGITHWMPLPKPPEVPHEQ